MIIVLFSIIKKEFIRLSSISAQRSLKEERSHWKILSINAGQVQSSQTPLPDHISARWQDIPRLMEGWLKAYNILHKDKEINAVILAAAIAFGFVFIHLFVDGNGRIHRYLIHHVLADLDFTPKGSVASVR